MFKSGFVAVVGRSNVGKSTLLNRIIGEHLNIVSNKPQTTRKNMQIILTDDQAQIIFIDTPGIQIPMNKLGEYMLKLSKETLKDCDIITYIVDHSDFIGEIDRKIIEDLRTLNKSIVLLINKSDYLSDEKILEVQTIYQQENIFESIIPISAINGNHIDEYLKTLKELLPEGPLYYEEDQLTDVSSRQICAELIREQTLCFLQDEIPHGIFVEITHMHKRIDKNIWDIEATISVEKKSHKGMVIGKNGMMLKKIGSNARVQIENLMQTQVHLKLWVKIDENWRNNPFKMKQMGFK